MANIPIGGIPVVKNIMRPLGISASGMSAQSARIELIARNIANADTTRTAAGGPYQRVVATLARDAQGGGVRVSGVSVDQSPGRIVYDPGHPDADENGYVTYPNVDVNTEMVDLMVARRIYEANATVFRAAKAMLRKALDI